MLKTVCIYNKGTTYYVTGLIMQKNVLRGCSILLCMDAGQVQKRVVIQ